VNELEEMEIAKRERAMKEFARERAQSKGSSALLNLTPAYDRRI